MTAATMMLDDKEARRRFRRLDLGFEERVFLRLLSTLAVTAWVLVLYAQLFAPLAAPPVEQKPIEVAKLLIKPPPPPEEKKVEPKPEPLPPRKETEKPKQAAPKPKAPRPAVVAKAEPRPEPPKRSVATMGLLSMLSSETPRSESASQRVGQTLRNVDFRHTKDLTEDVGSLTGTIGARGKVGVGEMVAGLPNGTGTNVVLEGKVVSPISGPGGPSAESAEGGGRSGRSIAEIRDIVAQYIAGLKYLYDRELKQRPSLHGKVTVEFVVSGPGSVSEVRLVQSGLGHPALESAILGRIRGWKFPEKPGDSTRVTFPFDFVAPAG